jgi:hypothetical protein
MQVDIPDKDRVRNKIGLPDLIEASNKGEKKLKKRYS